VDDVKISGIFEPSTSTTR